MQTRSQTRMEEGQAPMLRNSNVTSLPEPPVVARVSRNEERLQRRVEELEAQLRNSSQHSLHGSGAPRSISNVDVAGNELDSQNNLGYEFIRLKRCQMGTCLKFDGIQESGKQWIKHLERSGKRFNWDYTNQLATLIDSLEGKTKTWFDTLPSDKQEDLVFLKKEIITRFTRKETGASTIVKLANLKMKPDQEVEEFWYQVRKECHQMNEHMDLATVIAWFMNGLTMDIKEAIVEQAVEMDEKVVELAKRKQWAIRMRKKEVTSRSKNPVELILDEEPWEMPPDTKEDKEEVIQQINKKPMGKDEVDKKEPSSEMEDLRRSLSRLNKKVFGSNNREPERRPYKREIRNRPFRNEIECYQCHQTGHKKINCPTLRRRAPRDDWRKRKNPEPVAPEKRRKF